MNTNTPHEVQDRKTKQKGFTIPEVTVALIVGAVALIAIVQSIQAFQARARVSDALNQLTMIQSGMNDWAPRSGIFSNVPSVQELIDDGYIVAPVDSNGDQKAATEMNPWDGELALATGGVSTSYTVTFSGITSGAETRQLARRLSGTGTVTSDDASEVTVEIGESFAG